MDERKIIKTYAKKLIKGNWSALIVQFLLCSALAILSLPLFFICYVMTFADACWHTNFVRKNEKELDHYFACLDNIDNIGKIIVTRLLSSIWILLYTILLIIPGIFKAINLSQVKYLLREKPDMSSKEIMALSKELMRFHKVDYVVFQLSFIPYYILSILTLGIGFLFVIPYVKSCFALYFERLRNEYEYAHNGTFDMSEGVNLPDATTPNRKF